MEAGMRNTVLTLLAALAISANLLVPTQVMKYHACCLDEYGYPQLNQAPCCASKDSASLSSPNSCCNPKVVKLRQAPPQTGTQSITSGVSDSNSLAVLPQPPRFTARSEQVIETCTIYLDTGPPGSGSLLPILSRLNV